MLHDSVRVPEEAGLGVAKVRLSFDAWKAGHVAPATLQVPVVEPKSKPKANESTKRPEPKVADSKELRQTLQHKGYVSGLAYTPDGSLLATLDNNIRGGETGVHLWETATSQKRSTFPLRHKNSEAFDLQIDPAGKLLAVATREVKLSADGKRYEGWSAWGVTVWDIATDKEKAAFREEKAGTASVLAFQGNSLLMALDVGEPWKRDAALLQVMRLNPTDGKRSKFFEMKDRRYQGISVSPGGRCALVILGPTIKNAMTDARLLDLKTGKERPLWELRGSVATAGVFSPDGKTVAVFLWNKLRFWDVASGKELTNLSERYAAFWKRAENERLGRITAMRFSPDGKLLSLVHEVFDIPSRRDVPEIVLWDLATGEVHTRLRGHTSYVFNMAFAPDGRTLATGGYDKTVKLWNINPNSKVSRDR